MSGSNFFAPGQVSNVTDQFVNEDGLVTQGKFTGSVPTTANYFAPGCILVKTDQTAGLPKVYENVGTSASPSFKIMGGAGFVVALGTHTTAGGDDTESITVTGAVATDVALVTVKSASDTTIAVMTAAATTNAITVELNKDPSTSTVLQYVVLRAS